MKKPLQKTGLLVSILLPYLQSCSRNWLLHNLSLSMCFIYFFFLFFFLDLLHQESLNIFQVVNIQNTFGEFATL